MRRLRLADIERLRRTRGRTVLLYLTDRCPVGCAHCSVAALPDGPRVTDHGLLAEIVAAIGAEPGIEAVAISGGEPFAERRGLVLAVDALAEAGKDVVLFSSGYWASGTRCPGWVTRVLERSSTVILSTDGFHRAAIDRRRFSRAVAHAARARCHVILQLLDEPGAPEFARGVLRDVLGDDWARRAEFTLITPLRAGRGSGVFAIGRHHDVAELGTCPLTASPTIRYDGVVTGCCNESVITGGGPRGLRRRVAGAADVRAALARFRDDPLLRAVGSVPPDSLVRLPVFAGLARSRYPDICGLCWRMHEAVEDDGDGARLLSALMSQAGRT
ncbi:radical SAM protein [Nonomuraea sp. NPDC050643]|uniref:radical SAM protein n=1 Tax=Nonomuraea sp. NPDC050643 TaxID=3155660 RepID=UPI0033DB471B